MKIRTYFATVFDGMAKGLFASLIIGTIIAQIGKIAGIAEIENIGTIAKYCMGPSIGAGIALKRSVKPFTLLAAIAAGAIGAGTVTFANGAAAIAIGEPIGAFVAAICGIELGKIVEGKTKIDLLVVPAVVISTAAVLGIYVSPVIADAFKELGVLINKITEINPLLIDRKSVV